MVHNVEFLAEAVVERAIEDYMEALVRLKKYQDKVNELERFFTGEDIKLYTDFDGTEMMNAVRQEVKDYQYNITALKKSHGFGKSI